MAETDLYSVLGVKRDASKEDIRRAFHRLARQHHPDVNPGDAAAVERFKQVSTAYDVLGDEKKRKAYDEFGEAALRSGFDPEKARQYQEWQRSASPRAGAAPREGGYDDIDFDLGDLFGGARARRGPAPGEDTVAHVDLDLATALRGTELSVEVPTGRPCPTCRGAGHTDDPCPRCQGKGRISIGGEGPMRIAAVCPACGGSGHPHCSTCHGTGDEPGTRRTTVRIPPGADDGSRLRVPGLGRPGRSGGPPGDLYIEVGVRPHRHFRRDGLDLHLALPVTIDEAYNGGAVDVPTPEGMVALKVPARSQSGQKLRLRGRGVRRGDEIGDLYCELEVRVPDIEDPQFTAAARDAARLYSSPVREGLAL